jgi:hypothetical protein
VHESRCPTLRLARDIFDSAGIMLYGKKKNRTSMATVESVSKEGAY